MECSKKRESNLEMLRIVAMLLIVAQHIVERGVEGGWTALKVPFSFNFVTTVIIGIWGQLGVLLFVIISSWFLVDRQGIKSKKILSLVFQTWSTCVVLIVVFLFFKPEMLNFKLIVKELLTPAVKQYWFITTFLVFYLIVPLLQKSIAGLSNIALRNICIVLTMIIPVYNYFSTNVGDTLADFCYIFYLVAYLKRNKDNFFEKYNKLGFAGMALIVSILLLVKIVLPDSILGKNGTDLFMKLFLALRGRTLLMVIISVCIFYYFKNLKFSYYKVINIIGGSTFGVYIIHENFLLRGDGMKSFLWDGVFHMDWWYNNSFCFFIIHIIVTISVFAVCIVIDLLRKNTVGKLFDKNKKINEFCIRFDDWYSNQLFK